MSDIDQLISEANQKAVEQRTIQHDAGLRAEMWLGFKYSLEDLRDKLNRDKEPGK